MSKPLKTERGKNSQPNPRPDDGKDQERRISGKIGVIGQIEASLSSELVEEYKNANRQTDTREKQRDRRESCRFFVEVITLVSVVFVAILSLVQSQQAIRTADSAAEANRLSKANFVSDQRPYIGTRLVTLPEIRPDIGSLPLGAFDYKNFGKEPALHVKVATWIFTGPDEEGQVDRWFAQMGEQPLDEANAGVLNPEGKPEAAKLSENIEMPTQEIRASSLGLTPNSDLRYALLAARIEYHDVGGNRYWTDTCWRIMRGVPGPPDGELAMRCNGHNNVR